MAKKDKSDIIRIDRNKKAFFDFEILDRYEAGIVLTGSEIKSARKGGVRLKDGYVRVRDGEVFLIGAHIAKYKQSGNLYNHDPLRERKLLLHKREIKSIDNRVQKKGLTILPLSMYIKNNRAKVEIGLARSKKKYDHKQDIINRQAKLEAGREMKRRSRNINISGG